jgi:DNA (cytosine-5)-methyltransferase 1
VRAAEFDGVVGGDMKHLGDITKIHGCAVPIADCVIGGSPCQDLSVAGKREGLAGARSGLFMEQIRIVKEMRYADQCSGRTGQFIRPRYMVWENVPGAFSSNDTEDFRAVLEETARVADANAAIPRPPKKWANAGCIMGDGWSIAWRVLDAQFWGVPQRRRRIALVADFGGHTAPEILFERDGLCWDSAQSGTAGERITADAERSTDTTIGVKCLNPSFPQSARVYDADGVWHSLNANENGGQSRDAVLAFTQNQRNEVRDLHDVAGSLAAEPGMKQQTFCIQGNCIDRADTAGCNGKGWTEDVSYTLNTIDRPAVFDARGNGDGATVSTLTGDHQNRVTDYTAVVTFQNTGRGWWNESGVAATVRTPCGVDSTKANLVGNNQSVRRLTPLECERLQGFPDVWTDIGAWTDSNGKLHKESSDSARYKALGNSIALPPWKWVLKRLCAFYERDATMASLFDGIGGFPLIWEQLNGKGSCLWASEIEEFPIAVTKRHFSELEATP